MDEFRVVVGLLDRWVGGGLVSGWLVRYFVPIEISSKK